jgi:hypothetical protein
MGGSTQLAARGSGLGARDSGLDELYKLPPDQFTAARNALAKTLTGEAAREVKALKKPNAVAWSVNQLFWKARPFYDALMKAGRALRDAQLGALKGKKTDVRTATEKHRDALAHAVKRAEDLAHLSKVHPNADQLSRMLDALSLAPEPAANAGHFSDVVQPSGFDALAGVTPVAPRPPSSRDEAKKRKEKEEEKARRQAEARLDSATTALDRAREKADAAKRALNRAEADLADAEREVEAAEQQVQKAVKSREG